MARDLFQEAGIAVNPPGRDLFKEAGITVTPKYVPDSEVFGTAAPQSKYLDPKEVFGTGRDLFQEAGIVVDRPVKKRTTGEAIGDTAIDVAKGVVGLGESVVGLTDLVTGNLAGQGWSELGFDPARTKQILSEGYSDSRQQANANVADAKGFVGAIKSLIANPSAAVGAMAESAPMMLGSVAAVRTAAAKMLASRGLVAGSAEAAAFLENPAVVARLTAIGSAAEGATTTGQIQEQGRQAGRSYMDTAPAAVAAGALTGAIGFGTSKIPGFKDAEVGAAVAGMGKTERTGLITAGKEIAKGAFKEGVLEELPQSTQEQIFTNLALGQPWDQGVAEAAAQGMVAGAGMGGGMNTYSAGRNALAGVAQPTHGAAPSAPQVTVIPPSQPPVASKAITDGNGRVQLPQARLAELEIKQSLIPLTEAEVVEAKDLLDQMMAEKGVPPLDAGPTLVPTAEPAQPATWDGYQSGDRIQHPSGVTGTLKLSDAGAYVVPDTLADGTPGVDGAGLFSVTPGEVSRSDQPAPALANMPDNFWTYAKRRGFTPAEVSLGSPAWTKLKADYEAAKTPVSTRDLLQEAGIAPSLQNRDRGRAASVVQMASIASQPDYMRLGPSRTPDSGAPMAFASNDDAHQIPGIRFGREDTAVMADGQRVPFRYAVVEANRVHPSNFVDGSSNPGFTANEPGTLVALNNGRTAGLRSAYERGNASTYLRELVADAQNHGVPPEAISGMKEPMLVRVYAKDNNTQDMAAKSQGQGLGMTPGELARQDAPLMDATVLTMHQAGDVSSAANRDFVRGFIGKLQQSGQDIAGLLTAQGDLSPNGRTRIQAALVQAAYGDSDLVQEMFDSQDTNIKAIGEALKIMAGPWANMRDSVDMGVLDAEVDITGNLMQAVQLVRKSRQERKALIALVNQPDLLTGEAPDVLTVSMLNVFYSGPGLTRPLGKDKTVAMLSSYVQAAMNSSSEPDMFGNVTSPTDILATITQTGVSHDSTQTQEGSTEPNGSTTAGQNPDQGGSPDQRLGDDQARARPGADSAGSQEDTAGRVRQADQATDQGHASLEPKSKIEDAGQKIGGARKDRWKDRGLDLSDLDSMSESEGAELATKVNVWKPDYAGIIERGTRPEVAAFIKVVYDSLAAKPKVNTPEGRRHYVTAMHQVRQVYTEVAMLAELDSKQTARNAMSGAAEALKVRLGVRSTDPATVKQGKALLFSVYKGRSDPFVVSYNEEQRAKKLVADGFPNGSEPWKKRLDVGQYGGNGLTARGIDLIVEESKTLGTPVTSEQVKAGVYRVVSKAGKALAYLPTLEDAQAAAKTIYEGKLKSGASDKVEPARPHLDTLKRENLPQRLDRDVTADDLVKDFGFRGVEFGNWAAQDERQRILNMAYDGLRDLAEIMGVPPKAMSLNGSLGMAFGARGGGKFAAHYEPGKLVINMTKLQGGGSMAHEWAHALDHYLGELDRPDAYTTAARGASGWYTEGQYKGVPTKRMEQVGKEWKSVEKLRLDNLRPELAHAFDRVMSALFSGQETKAQMIRGLELQLERTQSLAAKETDPQTKAMYERMAVSQSQNLDESRQEPDDKTYPKGRSAFAKEAQKLSGKSVNGYWTRPTEMFARAFEGWVFDKVAAMGARSDYLVHGVEADRFAGGQYKGNPYPTGPERATINATLDNLAKTIKTKETDKGVAMFARHPRIAKSLPVSQVQSMVNAIRARWANAPDVVVLASMDAAPAAVLTEYNRQNSQGATGSTEGFYFGGQVYVVADQLATPTDVMRVLFHEALGHAGLRGVFGTAIKDVLGDLLSARRSEVAAKAKLYGLDMAKREDALTAAEELLAEMAQTKPDLGFIKRAVAGIRTWMRANVPGFEDMALTDDEIIRNYILPARAFIERGATAPAGPQIAFSRSASIGSSAFDKWFAGSKIVDAKGKPLVVYHGTTKTFSEFKTGPGIEHVNDGANKALGFFFTNDSSYADGFLEHPEIRGAFADGGQIVPVYLAIRNPKIETMNKIEDIENRWTVAQAKAWRNNLEAKGYDGIIFRDGKSGSAEYVAFRSEQIKSSIGNSGAFDPANPDIRFSRNTLDGSEPPKIDPEQNNAWTIAKAKAMKLTSPEAISKLIYEFQDKFIDLKNLREHIKALGGTITDLNDAYLGEELFHQRLAKRTQDFLSDELKPLLADMRVRGITLASFEEYLHARHAPEANAQLARHNPSASELHAQQIKARDQVRELEADLTKAKHKGTATKAIEESLVQARAELSVLNSSQAFKGDEDKRQSLSGMSNEQAKAIIEAMTPARKASMEALAAKVDAMTGKTLDVLQDYGLMNRAALSSWRNQFEFYVPLHRDEAHAESSKHPTGQGFSVKGDAAKSRVGSNEKVSNILAHIALQREAALTRGEKNNVVKKLYLMASQNPDSEVWEVDTPPTIKTIDSNTGFVRTSVDPGYKNRPNVLMVRIGGEDAAIVFNEHNKEAVRLAGAMKNLDVGDLHVVLGLAAKGTRWFAAVNTQYNPIFGLINFARDLQDGLLNLSTTPIAGKQLEVTKGVLDAMRAVYREGRGKQAVSPAQQTWLDLWDSLQSTGGTTGYRDLYADVGERVSALEKELKSLDRGEVSKAAHAVVDWLSTYNQAMENAVRLSAFKVALDSGLSKERAASLAKNLTVNFNRKGRQTREIGALYAFFNAAIQGTTRMAETLRGPVGKRIMLGGVMLGAVNALVGMAMMGGGDDDWDKIPDFIKERSLIIPLGQQDFVSIPMPLGFKLFPNIGRLAVEFAFGSKEQSAGQMLGKLLSALVDTFNPLGGAQNLGQLVAPTVIDPVVALMQNKDWTGHAIYRENSNGLDQQPGHATAKDSASTVGKGLAKAINSITGGTEYRPGAWSPTPDQLDYVFGQLTGGLGRELLKVNQTLAAQVTGDELPPYKIPLVGRLYGNTRGQAGQSEQFYQNVKAINEVENELRGRMRNRQDVEELRKTEPLTNLIGAGNQAENMISKLRKVRKTLTERAEPGYQERVKEIDGRIAEVMTNLNREVTKAQSNGVNK